MDVNLVRDIALRLKKELMPGFLWELNHLILDRWTIAWSDTRDLPRIERRFVQVSADCRMNGFGRISEMAIQLLLPNWIGGERNRHRALVRRLWLKRFPIDCSSIKPRRGAGLQTANSQ